MHPARLLLPCLTLLFLDVTLRAQSTFETTIPVPGLTNVAGGRSLPDGGFVFGGELEDGVVVVRTDSTGAVLWTRALAEAANDEGIYDRSVIVSGDRIFMGGYALGPGTASRDGILHLLDFDGNVVGQRLIHAGTGSNAVHGMTGIADGALIAGRAEGAGSYDMLLQRVDMTGNVTGSWSFGSTGWDWAYEAIQLADNGMALVGYGDDVGGPAPSVYLVRASAAGEEVWARALDGASADEGYCVMEDPDNGDLYIGGRTLGMGSPGTRGFVSKFSGNGEHQWTRAIGNAFDVIGITKAGGRFVALVRAQNINGGHGNYDELLVFFGEDGELLGNRLFGGSGSDYPVSLSRLPDGGLLITSLKSDGGNSIRAVRVAGDGSGGCTGIEVVVDWFTYEPVIIAHTSTLQSGSNVSSWITGSTEPSVTSQFECCTVPVEAAFTVEPTGDPLTWEFTSTSTGATAQNWTIEGELYAGATVQHVFSSGGTYQVCLEAVGVCATDDTCASVVITVSGMSDQHGDAGLRAWPLPATDWLNLVSETGLRKAEFVDAGGRVALVHALSGQHTAALDVHSLAPGAYLLRLTTDKGDVPRFILKY